MEDVIVGVERVRIIFHVEGAPSTEARRHGRKREHPQVRD